MSRPALVCVALCAALGVGCGDSAGSLVLRANGINEARVGITAEQTADGWAVEFDHAIVVLTDLRLESGAGETAPVSVEPVAIELVPEPAVAFEVEGVPAQRWDRFSYQLGAPSEGTRSIGVSPDLLSRLQAQGWSAYYAGRLVAPAGTMREDGTPVTVVPFEFGFPVDAAYRFCVAGNDGTDGVVIPVNSAADYEVTWHMTHLFFDSFVEDASLRVEPMAALWDGEGPLTLDALDVPLGGLRAVDGDPLLDDLGNPVVYIPGMTGADTLREFVLDARPGHFNGLEGFCMTEVTVVE